VKGPKVSRSIAVKSIMVSLGRKLFDMFVGEVGMRWVVVGRGCAKGGI